MTCFPRWGMLGTGKDTNGFFQFPYRPLTLTVLFESSLSRRNKSVKSNLMLLFTSKLLTIKCGSFFFKDPKRTIFKLLIFNEKFSPLPWFEPGNSPVPSRYTTNWAILAWMTYCIYMSQAFHLKKGLFVFFLWSSLAN